MAITQLPKPTTDVDPEAIRLFDKTKGYLFYQKGAGFLGRLLASVDFCWTRDMQTAAISTTRLYWNPDFFMQLDKDTRVTVLAHELWHNGLAHTTRLGDRCPDLWNIAGDHVINLLLKKHGFYMDGFPYVMDEKYDGWSTDEVYDDLQKNPSSNLTLPILSGDIIAATTEEEIREGMGKIVSAFVSSKIDCTPGSVPGEVESVIDRFLNPKLPWHRILHNYFNEMVQDVYSYARPSRRYDDPIMPGNMGREGLERLMFAADISGSITDQMILRFFSEGKDIHDNLQPEEMVFVTFDTKVHDVFRIDRDDPYDTFTITGRGGTDLHDLFEFAKKEDATALVIFTDLYVGIPENPGIDIIWVVTGNDSAEVPYGKLIIFNEETAPSFKDAAPQNFVYGTSISGRFGNG